MILLRWLMLGPSGRRWGDCTQAVRCSDFEHCPVTPVLDCAALLFVGLSARRCGLCNFQVTALHARLDRLRVASHQGCSQLGDMDFLDSQGAVHGGIITPLQPLPVRLSPSRQEQLYLPSVAGGCVGFTSSLADWAMWASQGRHHHS